MTVLPITKTLDDITPNLSKYIPEDSAVLFLSEEDTRQYMSLFPQRHCSKFIIFDKFLESEWIVNRFNKGIDITTKPITIFIPHGTQSEIQKAEEVAKYLWNNFGIKPNLCVLHFFKPHPDFYGFTTENGRLQYCWYFRGNLTNYEDVEFNKIITTNSTGILKPEDSNECLQVIDCKEIFEDYLKTQKQFNKTNH